MRWPDGAAPSDARLADALVGSHAFAPEVTVQQVLRHVPGRRVTALGSSPSGPVVIKVFHGPRARGNERRLTTLVQAGLGHLVPEPLGHDESGRIGLLAYRPGIVLDQLPDSDYVTACGDAGAALGALHRSGAVLDREWLLDDELSQLVQRTPMSLRDIVLATVERCRQPAAAAVVPSHRDCHPRQLVADGGSVTWIDLDDCAMAPAGLDVGNMLAHLTRERLIGRRTSAIASAAREAFRDAYRWADGDAELWRWEVLSIARLAGLAESRHHDLAQRDALLAELQRLVCQVAAS